jgi:hypothetical protein
VKAGAHEVCSAVVIVSGSRHFSMIRRSLSIVPMPAH